MPDAASLGVLRDMTVLVSIAVALALAGYRLLRHFRPHVAWNHEGQVLSRPYELPDLLVLLGLGLFFISATILVEPSTATKAKDLSETGIGGLVSSMVVNLLVCLALLSYLHRIRGLNPAELFGLQHFHWRWLLKIVAAFAVLSLVAVNGIAALMMSWLQTFWPDIQPQDPVLMFQNTGDWGLKTVFIISVVFLAPLVEETVFRGFTYGVLKRYTDAPFAALSSSLMFAIIHMHVGSLVPLWLLAVLLCVAYEVTGCLLVPMLLHMIFNGTSIAMMVLFDVK